MMMEVELSLLVRSLLEFSTLFIIVLYLFCWNFRPCVLLCFTCLYRISCKEGMMQYYTISGFDESTAATWEESYLKTCASRSISGGGFYYFADRSFDDEVSR